MQDFVKRVVVLIGSMWAVFMPPLVIAQSADPTSATNAILSRPVSPGSIALLVEHSAAPAVQDRLSSALRSADPDVRAAAARVIFVVGMGQLVPSVAAALEAENSPQAAMEESRVIAYFGTPAQTPLIERAVTQIGPVTGFPVALVLATARGATALEMLPKIRATGATESTQADFIRLATRGDRSALAALALEAVRQPDATLLRATLRAARDAQVDLGDIVLESTLASEGSSDVTVVGLWHLLRVWNGSLATFCSAKDGDRDSAESHAGPIGCGGRSWHGARRTGGWSGCAKRRSLGRHDCRAS